MAKTIDTKLSKHMSHKELLKKIEKRLGLSNYLPDLSKKEVYRKFCQDYGRKITPALEKIDQWQARSYGHMFTEVIRGGYSNN